MALAPESVIESVITIAQLASDAILEVYESAFTVTKKADNSPLTAADLASHQTIVDGLQALEPPLPVLSEESFDDDYSLRSDWQEYWLVDPLDGTREFVRRNGEFTVNIALIHEHRPVLGVVHVPVTNMTYFGYAGGGAFRSRGGTTAEPIAVRKLGPGPVRVVGSRSHRDESLDQFLAALGDYDLVGVGSSIKFLMVAEGKADIYPRLGPTSEWDTAAADAVVEAAGGRVTDTSGGPLLYNAVPDILNPSFLVYGDASRNWLELLAGSPKPHD